MVAVCLWGYSAEQEVVTCNTFANCTAWQKCSWKFCAGGGNSLSSTVEEHCTEEQKVFELQFQYWTKVKYENLHYYWMSHGLHEVWMYTAKIIGVGILKIVYTLWCFIYMTLKCIECVHYHCLCVLKKADLGYYIKLILTVLFWEWTEEEKMEGILLQLQEFKGTSKGKLLILR